MKRRRSARLEEKEKARDRAAKIKKLKKIQKIQDDQKFVDFTLFEIKSVERIDYVLEEKEINVHFKTGKNVICHAASIGDYTMLSELTQSGDKAWVYMGPAEGLESEFHDLVAVLSEYGNKE